MFEHDRYRVVILLFCIIIYSVSLSSASSSSSSSTSSNLLDSNSLMISTVENINTAMNNNIPTNEREALYDLYTSTNGDKWKYQDRTDDNDVDHDGYWNFTDTDVNPCASLDPWQGLTCITYSNHSYITKIQLSYYNLQGTIPESIGSNYIHYETISSSPSSPPTSSLSSSSSSLSSSSSSSPSLSYLDHQHHQHYICRIFL